MRSADGTLLYVGITVRPVWSRVTEHARVKPWWADVVTIDVGHYASIEEADAAETVAIADEHPLYNIDQKLPSRRPVRPPRKARSKPTWWRGMEVNHYEDRRCRAWPDNDHLCLGCIPDDDWRQINAHLLDQAEPT